MRYSAYADEMILHGIGVKKKIILYEGYNCTS